MVVNFAEFQRRFEKIDLQDHNIHEEFQKSLVSYERSFLNMLLKSLSKSRRLLFLANGNAATYTFKLKLRAPSTARSPNSLIYGKLSSNFLVALNLAGLILGCIESDFCKEISFSKCFFTASFSQDIQDCQSLRQTKLNFSETYYRTFSHFS